jgi:hypothetical protein
MLDKFRASRSISRLQEEQLYALVLREIESGALREGIWAKAFSKSSGDESKTQALYIEMRVQSIIDEGRVAVFIENQLNDIVDPRLNKSMAVEPNAARSEEIKRKSMSRYATEQEKAAKRIRQTKAEKRDWYDDLTPIQKFGVIAAVITAFLIWSSIILDAL